MVALGRLRQEDVEFEASLIYTVILRTCLKKMKNEQQQQKNTSKKDQHYRPWKSIFKGFVGVAVISREGQVGGLSLV